MIVNLKKLPDNILKKIPLSIRLNTNVVDTDELPIEISYELRNYFEEDISKPYFNENVIDLTPSFDIYSDFKILSDKSKVVLEYIKNYLYVFQGEYPFDPSFGHNLKKYIQIRDIETRRTLLNNELKKISTAAEYSFELPIKIDSYNIDYVDEGIYTNVIFNLNIKINNEPGTITIVSKEEFRLLPDIK